MKKTEMSAPDALPEKIGAPATRALLNVGVTKLSQLKKFTQKEIAELHGVGPNAIGKIQVALKVKGWSFKG